MANQFIIFENVRIYKSHKDYPALKITGHSANYTFLNCEFFSEGVAGSCIYISSIYSGTNYNKLGSNAMSFINSGFGGGSEYGAIIEYAGNISFESCFFEAIDKAFVIKNSIQIKVTNSRFANCAGSGILTTSFTNNIGTCFYIEDSFVNIENNDIAVGTSIPYVALNNQYFVQSAGGTNNTVNLKDNSFSMLELSKTSGILQVLTLNNSTLTSLSKKLVFLNAPSTYNATTNTLKKINSTIGAGETVFIRANIGKITISAQTTVNANANENIYLNGATSITLNVGQAAIFIKIDDAGGTYLPFYQLVSKPN